MSNQITLAWCAEDRERIDRLTLALEAFTNQAEKVAPNRDACATSVAEFVAQEIKGAEAPTQSPVEPAEATKAETPATPQPQEEVATTAEPAPTAEVKPAPTTQELQQKVIALVNKGKKAEVSAIVKSYAATVSGIPEDKRAECMSKLNELEG